MSFASELSTIMNANTTINKLVAGIYRDTLSNDFNVNKNWIIYSYKKGTGIGVLSDKEAIKVYSVYVEIYTSKAATTESISSQIVTYLTNYTSTTFRDISFVNETHAIGGVDKSNDIAFITLLEFDILYQS